MTLRIEVQTLCQLLLLLSLSVLAGCTAEPMPSDLANMPDCAVSFDTHTTVKADGIWLPLTLAVG